MRRRILMAIDSDPAMGVSPFTDPEDAYALSLALKSPRVELLGIAVNFANTSLVGKGVEEAMASARRLLDAAGRTDVPLLRGAEGAADLGKETDAVRFLLDVVRAHPGEVTVVSLGSLTATATAMSVDPMWIGGVRSLVIMGGTLDTVVFRVRPILGLPIPIPIEYNVMKDPAAAKIVLEGAPNVTLVTLAFSARTLFTPDDGAILIASGTPLAHFLVDGTNLFQRAMTWALGGFILYDTLAVAYPLWPDLYSDFEETAVQVGPHGLTSRASIGPLVRVPRAVDSRELVSRLLEEISRP